MIRGLLFCLFTTKALGAAFLDEREYDFNLDLARRDSSALTGDLALARRQSLDQGLTRRETDDEFALVARVAGRSPGGSSRPAISTTRPRGASPNARGSYIPPASGSPYRYGSQSSVADSSASGSSSGLGGPQHSTPDNSQSILSRENPQRGSLSLQARGERGGSQSSNPFGPPLSRERTRSPARSPGGSPQGSPPRPSEASGLGQGRSPHPDQPDARAHGSMRGPGSFFRDNVPQPVRSDQLGHMTTTGRQGAIVQAANTGGNAESTLHATGKEAHAFVEQTSMHRTGVMQGFSPAGVETKIVGPGEGGAIQANAPPGQTAAVKVKTYGHGISGASANNRR